MHTCALFAVDIYFAEAQLLRRLKYHQGVELTQWMEANKFKICLKNKLKNV